ncbi:MAG: CBS domain-containing protein [Desulfurococcales archaeon]|nr:CBS domain-containing protein [Desulfurococcales archaeon]
MEFHKILVEDVAHDVPVLSKDVRLAEVIRDMEKARTDRVVLTTHDKSIAGILTKSDILVKIATERTRQSEPLSWTSSGFMTTPVHSIESSAPLSEAVKLMEKHGFTSVLVHADKPRLVDRFSLAEVLFNDPTPVLAVSRTPPETFSLNTRILHARQVIFEHGISIVPVLDEEGKFIGVIGIDEVLELLLIYYESLRKSPRHLTEIRSLVVADAIRMRPPTVSTDATLGDAARSMIETRYRGVVVVDDNGFPAGVITGRELVSYIRSKI